jgi:hypothetical protein
MAEHSSGINVNTSKSLQQSTGILPKSPTPVKNIVNTGSPLSPTTGPYVNKSK